jgi:hypothetical protein
MHSSVVDCEFTNCALIFCFFSHVGPPSNCHLGSDVARARQHLCRGHEGVPGDGVKDTHFVKQLDALQWRTLTVIIGGAKRY